MMNHDQSCAIVTMILTIPEREKKLNHNIRKKAEAVHHEHDVGYSIPQHFIAMVTQEILIHSGVYY